MRVDFYFWTPGDACPYKKKTNSPKILSKKYFSVKMHKKFKIG